MKKIWWFFYGGDTISVYDRSFKLLKQYPVKEQYESKMLDAIAENFTKVEKADWNAVAPMPEYFRRKSENGYTTFTSIKKDVSFTAKGDFWNSVIYGEEDTIILIDRKNELRYSFKIDFEKKRFLIPEKYQDLLELKFI